MTVSIKIECECGQRYEFEVEPVNGRVPAPVVCPACGVDGTAAANRILLQNLQASNAVGITAPGPLRIALPAGSAGAGSAGAGAASYRSERRNATLIPGQTTRTQAQYEARAKVLWGEAPLQVTAYLMSQGFRREDAAELVQELIKERIRTIRLKGIKYVSVGAFMLCVPALGFITVWSTGRMRTRAIGFLAVVGIFGAGLLIKGIVLLISPGSESGDASEEIDPDSLFD